MLKSKWYLAVLVMFVVFLYSCEEDGTPQGSIAVGASVADSINSVPLWNDIGITVVAGEEFSFSSTGDWVDLSFVSDADGYSNPILDQASNLKRVPSAKWFELIATIDSSIFYTIGKDTTITINESGTLLFFANDAPDFYGNNSGSIYTSVTRNK